MIFSFRIILDPRAQLLLGDPLLSVLPMQESIGDLISSILDQADSLDPEYSKLSTVGAALKAEKVFNRIASHIQQWLPFQLENTVPYFAANLFNFDVKWSTPSMLDVKIAGSAHVAHSGELH